MSVYKPAKSPYYSYDFVVKGHRFHGSTGATSKREALKFEDEVRRQAKVDIAALQATGKGTLAQLQVTVDISHPYIGDLGASLVSPECVRGDASRGHCQQCGQHRCDTYRRDHTRFRAVGG